MLKKNKLIILLILLYFFINLFNLNTQEKKNYIFEKNVVVQKALSMREKFWACDFFFEFCWFYSIRGEKRYKQLDLNSIEFQRYLQDQFSMYRIRKSDVFTKITEISLQILKKQIDPNFEYMTGLSQHVSMAVIRNLNNNIVESGEIDANKALSDFYDIYGNFEKIPYNIHQILVDENILNYDGNFFSYCDPAVSNYFCFFSKDIMPIFKEFESDIKYEIDNNEMFLLLDILDNPSDTNTSHVNQFETDKFKNYEEYSKLNDLLNDWSKNEQYFEFKNREVQLYFNNTIKKKVLYSDMIFQGLIINQIGLGEYYYNPNILLDNYFFIKIKNEIENKNN